MTGSILKSLLIPTALLLVSITAQASPWAAQNNSLYTEEQTPDTFDTKFKAGDSELEFNGGLTYNTFYGSIGSLDLAYRFAPARRFLIGLGGTINQTSLGESFSFGPEARIYFAEFQRWAMSFTQKFLWGRERINTSRGFVSQWFDRTFSMSSAVGAHFYISPMTSFNLSVEAAYLPSAKSFDGEQKLIVTPKAGVTLRFQ